MFYLSIKLSCHRKNISCALKYSSCDRKFISCERKFLSCDSKFNSYDKKYSFFYKKNVLCHVAFFFIPVTGNKFPVTRNIFWQIFHSFCHKIYSSWHRNDFSFCFVTRNIYQPDKEINFSWDTRCTSCRALFSSWLPGGMFSSPRISCEKNRLFIALHAIKCLKTHSILFFNLFLVYSLFKILMNN